MMNHAPARTTGDLVRAIMESIAELLRSEIELAKLELRASIEQARAGGGLLAGAALCLLFAVGFLLASVAFLLAIVMPAWAAALVVALLLLATAAILARAGKSRLDAVEIPPAAPIDGLRKNLEAVRNELEARRKERTDAH